MPPARPQRIPKAGLLLAAPITWLCWQRGGVDPAVSATVFGLVLAATAGLFLCGPHFGLKLSLPWPVAAIALLPALQLIPLAEAKTLAWSPWREEISRLFADLGVQSPSTISLYPYATLRSAVILAGCCALFVLARAVARRRGHAVAVAVALVAIAAGQAILGLWQAFAATSAPAAAADVSSPVHGSFVNRNHFAVLLEAGFCLAIGLAAFFGSPDRARAAGIASPLARLSCAVAAALCLAGIVASGSRMGIVVVGTAAVIATRSLLPRGKQFVLPLTLAALLIAVLSLPQNARSFEKLLSDSGDPGRVAIWSDALPAAARHFPAGSGLGTFAFAFHRREPYFPRNTIDHAHCDWLQLLVELGLPGVLLLTAPIAFAVACVLGRRKQNSSSPRSPLMVAFLLGAGAILLHSTVDFPLQIPAIAALLAVMLGSAVGLADDRTSIGAESPPRRPARESLPWMRTLSAVGCASFALCAAAVASGLLSSWDAEYLYQQGMQHLLAGRAPEADASFRKSLAANPYAAIVWLRRAEAAQVSREQDMESRFLELASRLEPFTFRTEWPAAQAALRRKHWEDAAPRLRRLAESVPDVRPAVFRAALTAGMPAEQIASQIVPETAAGVWLRLLVDRDAWRDIDHFLVRSQGSIAAAPAELRYLFDRLFQASQYRLMRKLWKAAGSDDSSEASSLTIPKEPRFAETGHRSIGPSGDKETTFESLADPFASGFGFQWVSHQAPGVRLHVRQSRFLAGPGESRTRNATPYIELDIHRPAASKLLHLSRYFAVAPAADYILEAQIHAANPASGEVRLEIWAPDRFVGGSTPSGRAKDSRVALPFQSDSYEVLQLRVVSRGAAHNSGRGRFLLGEISLRPAYNAPDDTRAALSNKNKRAGR